jgi:hypothetical protein
MSMDASSSCDILVNDIISKDSKLQMLLGRNKSGTENHWRIICRECSTQGPEGKSRAFLTTDFEIVLCTNKLRSPNEIFEALTHEATHAYDYANNRCDFSTCEGLAYTEIRAARDAECLNKMSWLKNYCIKSCATASAGNMFRDADKCVQAMFDKALADVSPVLQEQSTDTTSTTSSIPVPEPPGSANNIPGIAKQKR